MCVCVAGDLSLECGQAGRDPLPRHAPRPRYLTACIEDPRKGKLKVVSHSLSSSQGAGRKAELLILYENHDPLLGVVWLMWVAEKERVLERYDEAYEVHNLLSAPLFTLTL